LLRGHALSFSLIASPLKSVEILTVFLKDEQGFTNLRAHIRVEPITSVQPNEKAVVSQGNGINGRRASDALSAKVT